MAPQSGAGFEAVLGQQQGPVVRHQVYRFDDVADFGGGFKIVEANPHPPGLNALAAGDDLLLEPVRAIHVDPEEPVTVRAGAGTAASGLDAEQIVEHRYHKIVVQVALARSTDHKGQDWQAFSIDVS